MKKLFFAIFVGAFFTLKSYAINYFVATNGNNSADGLTLATPFLTIQKASDVAVPGDVVNVRTCVYREMVNIKANDVTFQAYNSEAVTINGTNLLLNWQLTEGNTYQTIMDWDVTPFWGTNQVFADGKMIDLVRWPIQTSADIIIPTNANANDVTADGNFFVIKDIDFPNPMADGWVPKFG